MRVAEHYTPRPADGASDRQELERRRQAPDVAKETRREQANKVARLEGEVERLAEAIASGAGSSKTLVAKLTDRETELKEAKATLEHLDGLSVAFEAQGLRPGRLAGRGSGDRRGAWRRRSTRPTLRRAGRRSSICSRPRSWSRPETTPPGCTPSRPPGPGCPPS